MVSHRRGEVASFFQRGQHLGLESDILLYHGRCSGCECSSNGFVVPRRNGRESVADMSRARSTRCSLVCGDLRVK